MVSLWLGDGDGFQVWVSLAATSWPKAAEMAAADVKPRLEAQSTLRVRDMYPLKVLLIIILNQ